MKMKQFNSCACWEVTTTEVNKHIKQPVVRFNALQWNFSSKSLRSTGLNCSLILQQWLGCASYHQYHLLIFWTVQWVLEKLYYDIRKNYIVKRDAYLHKCWFKTVIFCNCPNQLTRSSVAKGLVAWKCRFCLTGSWKLKEKPITLRLWWKVKKSLSPQSMVPFLLNHNSFISQDPSGLYAVK